MMFKKYSPQLTNPKKYKYLIYVVAFVVQTLNVQKVRLTFLSSSPSIWGIYPSSPFIKC